MLEPVGPLPAAVYWRRRAVALIAVVLAIAMIGWLTTTLFGGSAQGGAAGGPATSSSEPPTSASASTSAADDDLSGNTATGADSGSALGSAAAPGATASSADTSSAAPPGADSVVSDAPPTEPAPTETAPTSPAPAPAPPAEPGICDPAAIEVLASSDQPSYQVGDKPKLILSVVNKGAVDCYRDLNAAGQEVLIFDAAGNRLWSSNDCYPESSDDTRLLAPGQQVDFSIVWSGKVSEPTCTAARPLLGAGEYQLEARQGDVVSQRVPIVLQ